MSLMDRVMGTFAQASQTVTTAEEAVGKAKAAIEELRADIAAKKKARNHAEHGYLPPEEVKAKIAAWIKATADAYRRAHPNRALSEFGRPGKTEAGASRDTITLGEMCADFGPQYQAAREAEVDATVYEPGPPMADRARVVAKLDAELRELEQAEEALIDQHGVALGLTHRPEIAARREQEAGKKKRDDEWTAGARARQAAIDQQRVPTPRVGRSSYIDAFTNRRA
jgi:molybdopterin converting factor small subunit